MPKKILKWEDLYSYLKEYIKFGDGVIISQSATCQNNLNTTKNFCTKNNLDVELIVRYVESFGGYCDCEILYNVFKNLKGEIPNKLDKKLLGPSDPEPRKGDTFSFLVDDGKPGWRDGFKTREDA